MKCEWCPPKCFTQFPPCFAKYPGRCQKKNPGSVQDLHALAKRVMPKFFDGLELDYAHRMAPNKILTCNWVLSHTRPSGFRFGGIYTLRWQDDVMHTPTIHADINPTTFASNVGFLYFPIDCLRLEASMQRMAENTPLSTQLTAELVRPCATLTANLYDIRNSSGRGTLSLMRTITDHWAIGGELLVEWTGGENIMADTAFAARYSHHDYALATTFSRQGLDMSYWHRIHPKIQMASLLAWHRKTEKSIASVCYQWDFEDAAVRAMFDSEMSIGFMYNRALSHIPCSLGMSLLISLPTNRFVFGCKFNLDPSGFRRGE